MHQTTVRDAAFDLFRSQGMTTVFGNPGSTELPFLHRFPQDFRYVLGLHEAAVVGMAHGYALASGRPALVNLHTAAGVGQAMGALLCARAGKAPLVVTAGQQARPLITMEALLTNQDPATLPRPAVKWSFEPPRAQDVPAALARACHLAAQPPCGPVFVSLPCDDWAQPCETVPPRAVSRRTAPDPDALAETARALCSASSPALVAGAGVDAAGGWDDAVALAERLRLPVWAAPSQGRCGFPEDHPCFRGHLHPAAPLVRQALTGHDLIVVAGSPVFPYYLNLPGPILPDGARLVLITDDPDEAARAPVGDALLGDPALALRALVRHCTPSDRAAPGARTPPGSPATIADEVFDVLAAALPADAVVVNESPSNVTAFWQRVPIRRPGGYYFSPDGGLGFGLSAAVGIQLACPDRPVLAVLGDGSVQYAVTALWTAALLRVPVTFLVLRNDEYGVLKWFAGLEQATGVPGLDIAGIDHAAIAAGYGIPAARAASPRDLARHLANALGAPGPHLIEIRT